MSPTPTKSAPRPRVLSGMRPTGRLHLGNYMGALHNWVRLQQDYDCYFFIADLHALTTDYADPSRLKQSIFDVAVDFIAAGLSPGKCTMFIQSHVPQHAELHLLFSMFTPLGWLERVPTYKDQQAQLSEKDLNTYGFLGYPLLQSADILLYRPDFVPVGADQVAHVELTREVARKFNHLYSPKRIVPGGQAGGDVSIKTELDPEKLILPEPQVLLTPSPKLPGLDGRKMSKSYGNAIYLTDPLPIVMQKTQSMTNGGQRPTQADPGNPEICPVGDLHRIFSQPFVDERIRTGCTTATIRCDECKMLLGSSVFEVIHPIQKRREELLSKPDVVWQVLENGAKRAEATALIAMKDIRNATGLSRDMSGIRIHDSADSTGPDAVDFRNLSEHRAWIGLEPNILARNLREIWRTDILPAETMLKQESEGVFLTLNKRRVLVTAAAQNGDHTAWTFSAKAKTYEVLVLLCWSSDFIVQDFVVPQKLYLAQWVIAKKAAGKGDIAFSVEKVDNRFLLHIAHATEPIDITDTARAYGIL
ncbi:MAG: tryptophan--tRNA ligase [Acidobacteriota bacterium]